MATILIVDDNRNNRLLLASILKYDEHTIVEAEDGAAGLELAARHVPDLAIVDLNMPEIDGVTFIRQAREDEALSGMRIALSTGTTLTAAIADFMQLYRVDTIIPKPAEPEDVLRLVRSALG